LLPFLTLSSALFIKREERKLFFSPRFEKGTISYKSKARS
jgi:hypothetical protein